GSGEIPYTRRAGAEAHRRDRAWSRGAAGSLNDRGRSLPVSPPPAGEGEERMDPYPWLRFAHLVGLMLISAGLIGVFVADMRSRQVRDPRRFAPAAPLSACF